ncbi:trypco2 family protein [Streptomyces uncialis]|uniref:trypco2 family protein n=1 Tax=Streptomyces uncialis TaxID=1048205 RepID=UPI003654959B
MEDITIAEAVDHLRAEIDAARRRAADDGVRFELGDISMEFTVELRREKTANGAVKAWVVAGEAGTGRAETTAHRIAFTLRAVDGDGQSIRIANSAARTDGLAGSGTLTR